MSLMFMIVSILYLVGCGALIAAILLQKKRTAGVAGSVAGMGNVSDTYWDKNKSRSMEGTLERLTKIGGVLLGIFAVILCII